jgi:hypothetical protein
VKNSIYIILLVISGCYYDVEEELYPAADVANCDTVNTAYSARISPLISTHCATSGCHVPNGQLPDLSNYNDVAANVDIIEQRAIIEKTMPPAGPLPPCDIIALQTWINRGALNN